MEEAIRSQEKYRTKRIKRSEDSEKFQVGDILGVVVSPHDRTKVDPRILSGVVVKTKDTKDGSRLYRIQTEKCLLRGFFTNESLRKTLIDYEHLHELTPPTPAQLSSSRSGISLKRALQLHTGCKTMGAQHCLCKKSCKTNRCKCRKAKTICNTSCLCMKRGKCLNDNSTHDDNLAFLDHTDADTEEA